VVVLAGVGLVLNGYWPWGRLWVDFALVAFAGSFLLGIAVLSRTAKRIEKVGPQSDEGQQLIRRVFVLLRGFVVAALSVTAAAAAAAATAAATGPGREAGLRRRAVDGERGELPEHLRGAAAGTGHDLPLGADELVEVLLALHARVLVDRHARSLDT